MFENKKGRILLRMRPFLRVGATGLEPVTPSVSYALARPPFCASTVSASARYHMLTRLSRVDSRDNQSPVILSMRDVPSVDSVAGRVADRPPRDSIRARRKAT